jgi:hypothetical protein
MMKRHKWSVLSIAITIGMCVAIGSYTQYQYRIHHVTNFSGVPTTLGGLSVVASVTTGAIAAKKEHASLISLTAILLGALSIMFYTV